MDSQNEIAALIRQLRETQMRLHVLTGGEVDAVTDSGGQSYLLHEAQEKLRHSEAAQRDFAARQSSILDALSAHIALINDKGIIVCVNEAWRLFAIANALQSPDFCVGQNYLKCCDQATGNFCDGAHEAAEGIRSVLSGSLDNFSLEYPCHSPHEHRWFQLNVTRMEREGSRGAVVTHVNITERNEAEQALRASEAEFRTLAESMPQMVWITRPDGSYVYFSQQWMDYTGLTLEESLGDGWARPFHPEDRQRAWNAWKRATTGSDKYSIECRLRRADGIYRWWLIRGAPQRDDTGRIRKWFGTCTDIHDIRELNAELDRRVMDRTVKLAAANMELQNARVEADRANRAKSEFLSHMSHELRTPLSATLGFAQILQRGNLDARQVECVENIITAGNHLVGLINELLEIARIEAGHISITPEVVSVLQVAHEVLEMVKPMAQNHDVRLDFAEGEASSLDIVIDRQRLKQVLLNLLGNAVKYNHRGGSVGLEWVLTPLRRLRVSVTDSGPGISQDQIGRLFTPFERLDAGKQGIAGTGLGLVVTRRLVEAMGGTVGVQSALGKGSTFWFEVPVDSKPQGTNNGVGMG